MGRSFLSHALIGEATPSTAPLQGLRTLFNYLMVAGHTYLFTSFVLDYPALPSELDKSASAMSQVWYAATRFGVYIAVDIFFFLSGFFLMASLTRQCGDDRASPELRCARLRPSGLVQYVLSRWLRLAPTYLLSAAVLALTGHEGCIRWAEVLFMNNLAQRWGDRISHADSCLGMGWSMQVDFQMHIAVALLATLVPTWQAMQHALLLLACASGAAKATTWHRAGAPRRAVSAMVDYIETNASVPYVEQFLGLPAGRFDVGEPGLVERRRRMLKYTPWDTATVYRGSVVCVGAATWLALREPGALYYAIRRRPLASLVGAVAVWAGVYRCMWVFYGEQEVSPAFALYEGFGRLSAAGALGVVAMLVCEVRKDEASLGGAAGIVGSLLGNRVWVALARMSYAVYLTHPFAARLIALGWPRLSREEFRTWALNVVGVKWYLASLVVAVPFCLVEEVGLRVRRRLIQYAFGKKKAVGGPALGEKGD